MSTEAKTAIAPPPAHVPNQLELTPRQTWMRRFPLMPALLFTIIMTQLPFVATLVISFMNWNAYRPDQRGFAGLSNYVKVFTDPDLLRSVWVTVLMTVTVVLVSLVLGLAIALLLNRAFIGR